MKQFIIFCSLYKLEHILFLHLFKNYNVFIVKMKKKGNYNLIGKIQKV